MFFLEKKGKIVAKTWKYETNKKELEVCFFLVKNKYLFIFGSLFSMCPPFLKRQ